MSNIKLNLQLFASIVDYLNKQGKDSSFNARKQLATQYGISNYTGSAEQNNQLLSLLQGNAKSTSNTSTAKNTSTTTKSANTTSTTNRSISALNGVDQSVMDRMNSQFKVSNAYTEAMSQVQALLDKINSGKTSYSDQVKDLMNQIQNREEFSYDVDNDKLFQQYLSSMMTSGQTAMQDTMGQASALTGGYGSSYSQSVGNQAYNQHIQQAYDNLPEYYQMAMQKYQMEGEDMYNQLAMLSEADAQEYARLVESFNANKSTADTMWSQEYQTWSDDVANATNIAGMQNSDWWNNKNYEESVRQFNENLALQKQQLAKSGSGSKNSDDKRPSETQCAKAVEAYETGGAKGLEKYLASVDPDLQDALMDYALEYGKSPAQRFQEWGEGLTGILGWAFK